MPSDMDAPKRHPRDFSKPIARLEKSVQNAVISTFRRRPRRLFGIVLICLVFFYWLIRSPSSTTQEIPLPTNPEIPTPLALKYFHENPNSSHLDLRFSYGTPAHTPLPPDALANLMRSFVLTMRTLGVTPWLAHGTLLGWNWGRKLLPWDTDVDIHVSFQDLTHLATHYNFTNHEYEEYGARYLLDINPNYLDRTENKNPLDGNRIDARWVDRASGVFIDITAVEVMSEDALGTGGKGGKKAAAKGKKFLKAKDGHSYEAKLVYPLQKSYFEGVDCYVPQAAAVLLVQEYGQKALTSRIFQGYKWDDKSESWKLMSRITKNKGA